MSEAPTGERGRQRTAARPLQAPAQPSRERPGIARWFARHWPALLFVGAAAFLMLTGLGRDYLWEDEGDTAVLARGILAKGVPVAWDGVMLAVPDHGQRLGGDFVMVSHPWLQYYMAAGSFALLGETPFAARLPFAIAGIATVLVVYLLALRLLGSRRAAISAALMLLMNVQFLLYARQARNYSIHALLTCLVVWQFFRLDSARKAIAFTLLGILLFHAHPLGLVTIGTLALLSVAFRSFHPQRRFVWPSAAIVAAYAAPWLGASQAGYAENSAPLQDLGVWLPRLLQFLVECASVTPLVGVAALLSIVALARRHRDDRQGAKRPPGRRQAQAADSVTRAGLSPFSPGERNVIAVWAALGLAYAVAMSVTQSRDVIWIVGVRYVSAVIPLTLVVAGLLIAKISQRRRPLWIALTLLFGLTSVARLTPWVLWADRTPLRPADAMVAFHVPTRSLDGILPTAKLLYVESLFRAPRGGAVAGIAKYLSTHASPGDLIVTNYAWEAVYFHTRLPQALKVAESFPIYSRIRARLPDYVFSARGVKWIVWRQAWAPFWGQDCERLLRGLTSAGIRVEHVASIPETLYENRENLHFRRLAGRRVFPWFSGLSPVRIYRVDWPSPPQS